MSLDLAFSPIEWILAFDSMGPMRVLEGSAGLGFDVTVPIDATTRFFIADLEIDLSLTGYVGLKSTAVPEPGTGLILATGVAVATAARRQRSI